MEHPPAGSLVFKNLPDHLSFSSWSLAKRLQGVYSDRRTSNPAVKHFLQPAPKDHESQLDWRLSGADHSVSLRMSPWTWKRWPRTWRGWFRPVWMASSRWAAREKTPLRTATRSASCFRKCCRWCGAEFLCWQGLRSAPRGWPAVSRGMPSGSGRTG
jgi:hypothetical protein